MPGTYTELYAMIASEKMLDLVLAAFPVDPMPTRFFWAERRVPLNDDIAQDLRNKISGRPWTEITLEDWLKTGGGPVVVNRAYMEPAGLHVLCTLLYCGSVSRHQIFIHRSRGD